MNILHKAFPLSQSPAMLFFNVISYVDWDFIGSVVEAKIYY